jgi:CheY-like chemotaxis protein
MKPELITFLIDDDADDQEIFLMVLKQVYEKAQCFFASDGFAALQKIKANASFLPHLIFIDINMPRMNGIQCLAEIKKTKWLEEIPIYMYSTSAEKAIVDACRELGATGFLKKRVDPDDLKNDLIRIISLLKMPLQHGNL